MARAAERALRSPLGHDLRRSSYFGFLDECLETEVEQAIFLLLGFFFVELVGADCIRGFENSRK